MKKITLILLAALLALPAGLMNAAPARRGVPVKKISKPTAPKAVIKPGKKLTAEQVAGLRLEKKAKAVKKAVPAKKKGR